MTGSRDWQTRVKPSSVCSHKEDTPDYRVPGNISLAIEEVLSRRPLLVRAPGIATELMRQLKNDSVRFETPNYDLSQLRSIGRRYARKELPSAVPFAKRNKAVCAIVPLKG